MFSGTYLIYTILTGAMTMLGMFISNKLKTKMQYYGQYGLNQKMSGRQIAEEMLKHYGISDVKVISQPGFLTDHYNPGDKTVNLSEPVYNQYSITAAAVAAHECGHAVQHATAYSMLSLRSNMVPVVKFASTANQFLLPAALYMAAQVPQLMLVCIVSLAATTAFALVTLPVEFDASNRAIAWLENSNTCNAEELVAAKDALKWAALTYVAAALSSLVILVFLILQYMSRRQGN
jgi:uncharacterized protein